MEEMLYAAAAAAESLQSCPTLCDLTEHVEVVRHHLHPMLLLLLSHISRVRLCATP